MLALQQSILAYTTYTPTRKHDSPQAPRSLLERGPVRFHGCWGEEDIIIPVTSGGAGGRKCQNRATIVWSALLFPCVSLSLTLCFFLFFRSFSFSPVLAFSGVFVSFRAARKKAVKCHEFWKLMPRKYAEGCAAKMKA